MRCVHFIACHVMPFDGITFYGQNGSKAVKVPSLVLKGNECACVYFNIVSTKVFKKPLTTNSDPFALKSDLSLCTLLRKLHVKSAFSLFMLQRKFLRKGPLLLFVLHLCTDS